VRRLTPVIPATQKAEMRATMFKASLGRKLGRLRLNQQVRGGGTCL
jgi:hypothetical protein